mgnify:CR=1 FL=1
MALDGTMTVPAITFEDDQDTGIFRPAANQLAITCSGETVMVCSNDPVKGRTVDICGNVSFDLDNLDISGQLNINTGQLYIKGKSGDTEIILEAPTGGHRGYVNIDNDGNMELVSGAGKELQFHVDAPLVGSGGTQAMTVDLCGNVKITPGSSTWGPGTGSHTLPGLHVYKPSGRTFIKTEVLSNSIVGYSIAKNALPASTDQEWWIVDGATTNGLLEVHDASRGVTRICVNGREGARVVGGVGINTVDPSAILHCHGTEAVSSCSLRLTREGNWGPFMHFGVGTGAGGVGSDKTCEIQWTVHDGSANTLMFSDGTGNNFGRLSLRADVGIGGFSDICGCLHVRTQTSNRDAFVIDPSWGCIGIGTKTMEALLDIIFHLQ